VLFSMVILRILFPKTPVPAELAIANPESMVSLPTVTIPVTFGITPEPDNGS
jgi:hypothetical protein